jgi:hypothetical protein
VKLTGENRSTRGKTCPSATLSTINPTLTRDRTRASAVRGRRLSLSHGTADYNITFNRVIFEINNAYVTPVSTSLHK